MTQPIDPALYARMESLVREAAKSGTYVEVPGHDNRLARISNEARAIVAQLPAPTDPDLLVAREAVAMCARWMMSKRNNGESSIIAGEWDDSNCGAVQYVLAAIKRVRQEAK